MITQIIPKEIVKKIKSIEEDCLELQEQGNLTEYGRGELHIIEMVKGYLFV